MLAPVKRCQSPISTASAKPVNVEMPRRQARRRASAELAVTRDRGDLLIQSVTASLGQQHCLIRVVESGLRRGRFEALMTQPTIMQLGSGFAVVIDDPVPQQQL